MYIFSRKVWEEIKAAAAKAARASERERREDPPHAHTQAEALRCRIECLQQPQDVAAVDVNSSICQDL